MNLSKSHFFLILILAFFYISCQEEIKENIVADKLRSEVIETSDVDSTEILIEKLVQSLITNRNAEEKLKEFGINNPETRVTVYTKLGKLNFFLYKNTPLHRANFVMLAKKKFYDNTLFYRIIDDFMIQGGNSDNPELNSKLNEIGGYRIPNEISPSHFHKKGALAMAVSTEEQGFGKKSSAINFYIIEGKKMNSSYFTRKEKEGKKFTTKQKQTYASKGGAPHLDGNYTVFGELTGGFETLNRISKIKTDKYDWPIKDFYIDSIRAY